MHQIRDITNANHEKAIDNVLDEINLAADDRKMFKAVKNLKRKRYENPYVNDSEGKRVVNPSQMYSIIREHFCKHFVNETSPNIIPFIGPPRKLNKEISAP